MGGEQIFTLPAVAELGPWVLVAIFMVPKILEWIQQWRGKKLDADTAKATADVQVEIENIKGSYARQEKFQDTLVARCEKQMNEIESLLDRISALNGNVMQRDESIRQKDAKMLEMQQQINRMQCEIDQLKAHVLKIEADRDKIKAACVVEIPKE